MARQEKKFNYIYKITCKVTNRYYIGMHSTDNLNDGYFGSGKRLWFSINYHGKANHIKEILEWLPTREALKNREKELVTKELINEELCMNLQLGGEGGFSGEEHRRKFLEKAVTMFVENKVKIKNRKKWLFNNDDNWSTEYSNKMSSNSKGNKSWTDKKHTSDSKQLMSESHKGKHDGDKNSQFGTCWITKEGVNKKIKKEDLDSWINKGWIQGRIKI